METKRQTTTVLLGVAFLLALGCAGELDRTAAPVSPNKQMTEIVDPGLPNGDLKICSKLDFSGVSWSQSLPIAERDPFALALNITGSFEGGRGFANVTGNFDGQGISLGLLQQCLGQGSLQPLLLESRKRSGSDFYSFFSSTRGRRIDEMLDLWAARVSANALSLSDLGYSELDEPSAVAVDLGVPLGDVQSVQTMLLARNQESVDWAKRNALNGTALKPEWASDLKSLAASPGYRGLQVKEAESLHRRALHLFDDFQMREVRSYLFFFDIIVQNGGISKNLRASIKAQIANLNRPSEEEKLELILSRRLEIVKAQWRADVRARKMTIIRGQGVVHGQSRNLSREYCASLQSLMP